MSSLGASGTIGQDSSKTSTRAQDAYITMCAHVTHPHITGLDKGILSL